MMTSFPDRLEGARLLKAWLPIAGGLLAAIGTAVLVGWLTGNTALVQVIPTFAPMQYNEALGFLLAGGALLSLSASRRLLASTRPR